MASHGYATTTAAAAAAIFIIIIIIIVVVSASVFKTKRNGVTKLQLQI